MHDEVVDIPEEPQRERPSSDRSEAFAIGASATLVALAVLWTAAALWPAAPFPPLEIASAVLRLVPGDVATFFIETIGHFARLSLAVGAVVGTVFFGAWALVRTRSGETLRPLLAALVLAAASVMAVIAGPGDSEQPLPLVVVTALAVATYFWVVRRLERRLSEAEPGHTARRDVLRYGLGLGAGLSLGGGVLGWVASRFGGPDTDVDIVAPASPQPLPSSSGFPSVPGLSTEVTSVDIHYEVDINLVPPIVQADTWRLKVGGLVSTPLELSFAELQSRFEVVEEYQTLSCISNEVGGDLVGHSLWGGVRLRDVLRAAGADMDAIDVVFRAADGYSDSIPLDVALDPQVLVAVSQNREPLTQRHGFPCRIRVPKIFGMKNVKWLTGIEVVDEDYRGYWMDRGWSDEAEVRTSSRMDVPLGGTSVPVGDAVWVAGVAWAGDRGISKVEVSSDGTTWQEAQLKEPLGPYSWTLWALRWTPTEVGPTVLSCRASDGTGRVQEAAEQPPHPSGSTGLHRVQVEVV